MATFAASLFRARRPIRVALVGGALLLLAGLVARTLSDPHVSRGFVSLYVAASSAWRHPGAPVYTYETLLQWNAADGYVASAVYPYAGSPLLLLVALPLTALAFPVAALLWKLLLLAASCGIALVLSALTWQAVQRAARSGTSGRIRRLRVVLRATSVTVASWRLPLLPLVLYLALLLLSTLGGIDWLATAENVLPLLLLLASWYAYVRGSAPGAALPLAAAIALQPLLVVFLLVPIAQRAWQTVSLGAASLAACIALPLVVFPFEYDEAYAHVFASQQLATPGTVGDPANEALVAAGVHLDAFLGHAYTGGVLATLRAERAAIAVLVVVTLILAIAGLGLTSTVRRPKGLSAQDTWWLTCILLLIAIVLVTPLASMQTYAWAVPAALMLALFPFVRGSGSPRWDRADLLAVAAAVLALVLLAVPLAANTHAVRTPAPRQPADLIPMMPAIAGLLIWGAAFLVLARDTSATAVQALVAARSTRTNAGRRGRKGD